MYKYLLCWRYLKTRYIALASVISVMLGVATMIVVNAVMAGFSGTMRDRLHGILADIVVESYDLDGFYDWREVQSIIQDDCGDQVAATAPTMETFGLLKIYLPNGEAVTRQVMVIGIRPEDRAKTGDFSEFVQDESGKPVKPSFDVPKAWQTHSPAGHLLADTPKDDPLHEILAQQAAEQVPDRGAILGYALATIHRPGTTSDDFIAPEGAKIGLAFPKAGRKPEAAYDDYTVVGFFKSGMSEYDSMHVYVPLERLQYMRMLGDGAGNGAVNQIQVQVKPGVDMNVVAERIQRALDSRRPGYFRVATWEEKQGPLLEAVRIEQFILNVLLFLIIAVAGFGILAIFSMIVVEKTRDIGVLKALGASNGGVRGIFLSYGLALSVVGCGAGMIEGLLIVHYLNDIERAINSLTGTRVFNPDIYYFSEIPTHIDPWTVAGVVLGAIMIAVTASVWPAQRASKLHPVQAIRFE
ncbi:FtsX-like permease family protein [bacterium]|nr:FtsX-like permease family protein [bacterium]